MEVGAMTAVGHVVLSVVLGFAILAVGFAFSAQASADVTEAVGLAMVAGGLVYGVRELRTGDEEDFEREAAEGLAKGEGRLGRRFRDCRSSATAGMSPATIWRW